MGAMKIEGVTVVDAWSFETRLLLWVYAENGFISSYVSSYLFYQSIDYTDFKIMNGILLSIIFNRETQM